VMMAELVVIIGGFLGLGLYVWLSIGGVKAHLDDSLAELDGKLAQVVQQVMQAGAQMGENAPNPMQQMMMGLIQQRMQTLHRGEDGQFTHPPPEL
jgi:hypothetical protein